MDLASAWGTRRARHIHEIPPTGADCTFSRSALARHTSTMLVNRPPPDNPDLLNLAMCGRTRRMRGAFATKPPDNPAQGRNDQRDALPF